MRLIERLTRRPPAPCIPPGERLYAVGDVHGRLDLMTALLARIEADDAARPPALTTIVFLGDLIDRGPSSAGVVARLMAGLGRADLVCLRGNHEASMLDALDGDMEAAALWLRHGGLAACASWGVADDILRRGEVDAIVDAARAAIPRHEREWLAARPTSFARGDYRFVHAGVRPGVPLDAQAKADLLWIRAPFLESRRDHGAVIVHGHSIAPEAEIRPNRIGIDTGAYASGRLTALGLDGAERWLLRTGEALSRHGTE